MKTTSTIDSNTENVLQLLSKDEATRLFGEAVASVVATDQIVTWAKFILTDDRPNKNKERIPIEEFSNIINTGVHKPVKMAMGEIKDGHEEATPIGVITNLAVDGNKIVALAALWDQERGTDIVTVKDMVHSGKPVNVSWEIFYGNSKDDNGVKTLLDTVLRAATIVGMPAYAGRTQFLAVAATATKWSTAYIEKLPDTSFLYLNNGNRYFAVRDSDGKIDPRRFPVILKEINDTPIAESIQLELKSKIAKMNFFVDSDASIRDLLLDGEDFIPEDNTLENKELEGKISELEAKLALASVTLEKKEKELADALILGETANTSVKTLTEEIAPLREFKLTADKAAERVGKLSAIKAKFEGANLTKSAEYFDENADKLLGLDENGLDFMLQEMVAFNTETGKKGEGEASTKKATSGAPNIPGEGGTVTQSDIVAALRERNKK